MFRRYYEYDTQAASRESGLACEASLDRTRQEFKEECDINTLIRRFGLGYEMPQGLRVPQYGDFSHISNYHEALNQIAAAGETFDLLPAHVRDRFQNDPGRFVDFCLDSKNRDELVSLGLAPKAQEPSAAIQATSPAGSVAMSAPAPSVAPTVPISSPSSPSPKAP